MTVNPKKLRPYDQPPKRRLTLIPSGPDSAATTFLVAAALWLVVAGGLGLLALALRIVTFELSFPLVLFDLSFQLDARRVEYAFVNASVYGWLSNAGFAAALFMTPRLLGRPAALRPLLFLAALAWNGALAGGIAALYVFDLGPNAPLSALPWLIDGGLATGAGLVTIGFLVTAGASLRGAVIPIWFAGVALLSIAGLTGLNALVGIGEWILRLDQTLVALISVFVERSIMALWLLGMAYATLHYVVPRATAQPLYSLGIGMLAFVTWLALAPLSGLGALLDTSIPYAVTSLGQVATMLLLVPASLTVINLALTMHGRWTLVFGPGTAAFACVALAFLLATSLLEAIGSLRSVLTAVGTTDWQRGAWIWAAYGTFTFAAFALADHGVPRLLRRARSGGLVSSSVLWLAWTGTTVAGLALMGGGMAEGSLLAAGTTPEEVTAQLLVYRAAAFLGFGLVALAGLAFLVNLFLTYTSGAPADYAVPGTAAAPQPAH